MLISVMRDYFVHLSGPQVFALLDALDIEQPTVTPAHLVRYLREELGLPKNEDYAMQLLDLTAHLTERVRYVGAMQSSIEDVDQFTNNEFRFRLFNAGLMYAVIANIDAQLATGGLSDDAFQTLTARHTRLSDAFACECVALTLLSARAHSRDLGDLLFKLFNLNGALYA